MSRRVHEDYIHKSDYEVEDKVRITTDVWDGFKNINGAVGIVTSIEDFHVKLLVKGTIWVFAYRSSVELVEKGPQKVIFT